VAPADDWVVRTAGEVRAEAMRRHPGEPPTCASGISPSGPVHLGNLRELMTPHFVADEVRKQGVPGRHILSWDDYDRLRRVPAGFDQSFAEHIGRPLTSVPDPCGRHENWAEHFKEPLRESLARLGVLVTEISQTQMYTSGAYTAQIRSQPGGDEVRTAAEQVCRQVFGEREVASQIDGGAREGKTPVRACSDERGNPVFLQRQLLLDPEHIGFGAGAAGLHLPHATQRLEAIVETTAEQVRRHGAHVTSGQRRVERSVFASELGISRSNRRRYR